jgi:hypothetical protein
VIFSPSKGDAIIVVRKGDTLNAIYTTVRSNTFVVRKEPKIAKLLAITCKNSAGAVERSRELLIMLGSWVLRSDPKIAILITDL